MNKMWVCVRVVWFWSHFPATMGQNVMPLLVWDSEMASWMLSLKCSEGSYSKHKLGLTVRFHISPCMNKSKNKPVRGEVVEFRVHLYRISSGAATFFTQAKKLFRRSHLEGMAAAQVLSVGTDAWFGLSQCWAGEEPDVLNRAVLQRGGLLWALCAQLSNKLNTWTGLSGMRHRLLGPCSLKASLCAACLGTHDLWGVICHLRKWLCLDLKITFHCTWLLKQMLVLQSLLNK